MQLTDGAVNKLPRHFKCMDRRDRDRSAQAHPGTAMTDWAVNKLPRLFTCHAKARTREAQLGYYRRGAVWRGTARD
jgi:hypothetical protein